MRRIVKIGHFDKVLEMEKPSEFRVSIVEWPSIISV